MNEKTLGKIAKAIDKLEPLEDMGFKLVTRSYVRGIDEMTAGGRSWSAKKVCCYNMEPGMLPETQGVNPFELDPHDLRRFSFELRRSAAEKVFKVLGEKFKSARWLVLNNSAATTTEIFLTREWSVTMQTSWETFDREDGPVGHLQLGIFVLSRSIV
ncbi:hypothetical protein [Luteolibacter sp. Populi]|uniref:hypothetical protein n=1 Tax=Luteolibacter sp. Populi TaxID=3230487 RepID=UPI0034675603